MVEPERLPALAVSMIENQDNEIFFSAASIWEVAIKQSAKSGFDLDPSLFRREMLEVGYQELPINGQHSAAVTSLPKIHEDPFDRILVAQANAEGMELLTCDSKVAAYPGPIKGL